MAGATSTSQHSYGTHINLDTLKTITAQSVLDFGEDRILAAIQRELDYHNEQMNEALNSFTERTFDQQRSTAGTAGTVEMDEIDEMGTPDAQKVSPSGPTNLGFPLRKYAIATQWTKTYFQNQTPADLAMYATRVLQADRRLIYRNIRRTLFRPLNYTFRDRLYNGLSYSVKVLANADNFPIPPGPNNEFFDPSTHTHYSGILQSVFTSTNPTDITTSAAAVSSLIATVQEHYADSEVVLYINQAQEGQIRAMTANFIPYVDFRNAFQAPLYTPSMSTYVEGVQLDTNPVNQTNRAIGTFNGVVVWIKPWMPANYLYAWNTNGPKIVAYRERREQSGDLAMTYENDVHPLRGSVFEREFGLGVQERIGAAALFVNSGGSGYSWLDANV